MWNFEHVNYFKKDESRDPKIHKDGDVWKKPMKVLNELTFHLNSKTKQS